MAVSFVLSFLLLPYFFVLFISSVSVPNLLLSPLVGQLRAANHRQEKAIRDAEPETKNTGTRRQGRAGLTIEQCGVRADVFFTVVQHHGVHNVFIMLFTNSLMLRGGEE